MRPISSRSSTRRVTRASGGRSRRAPTAAPGSSGRAAASLEGVGNRPRGLRGSVTASPETGPCAGRPLPPAAAVCSPARIAPFPGAAPRAPGSLPAHGHAPQKFAGGERLDEVVVRARFQPLVARLLARPRKGGSRGSPESPHRRAAPAAGRSRSRPGIITSDDQVRPPPPDSGQGGRPVGRRLHFVTIREQAADVVAPMSALSSAGTRRLRAFRSGGRAGHRFVAAGVRQPGLPRRRGPPPWPSRSGAPRRQPGRRAGGRGPTASTR